jgi:hypothetical protein
MADDITHYDAVEGYCGKLSYAPGEQVQLHVSCSTDRYDVEIHRWGATRELVWSTTSVVGLHHPTPTDADAAGCGWPVAIEVPIPSTWRSGCYHVSFTAHGAPTDRATSHAMFVLRPPADPVRRARILLVLATNTYHAYNTWGGRSLYTGGKQVSFRRPFGRGLIMRPDVDRDDRKSRPTRWGEEPDIDGTFFQAFRTTHGYPAFIGSTGWFSFERRFVEWAERDGFAFDMAVSSDLATHPEVVDGYDLLLGVGHDEYWSAAQRDTVEGFIAGGGNYASLSGNTCFWQVRLDLDDDEEASGFTCHKYSAHETDPAMSTVDPTAMTGMWADPVVGRPETAFLGAGSAWGLYSRFGQATARGSGAFTVYRDRHWLFEGTGLRYGDLLGATDAVMGYETVGCRIGFDDYQLPIAAGGDGTPSHMEVVAFTPASNLAMGEYPASISALSDQGDLEFVATRLHGRLDEDSLARHRYGNAVMVVCRPFGQGGGEVVTVGTTDWVFGLANDAAVATVTRNILRRPGRKPDGPKRSGDGYGHRVRHGY